MIVVDSNILVYLFVNGPQTRSAMTVRMKDPDWHVPFLWRAEFRNAMAGYIRNNIMTVEQAIIVLRNVENSMDGQEHQVNSADVMRLVSQSNCSAYDCEFVALAQELEVPLITLDRRVLRNFPNRALSPDQFLALPGPPTLS